VPDPGKPSGSTADGPLHAERDFPVVSPETDLGVLRAANADPTRKGLSQTSVQNCSSSPTSCQVHRSFVRPTQLLDTSLLRFADRQHGAVNPCCRGSAAAGPRSSSESAPHCWLVGCFNPCSGGLSAAAAVLLSCHSRPVVLLPPARKVSRRQDSKKPGSPFPSLGAIGARPTITTAVLVLAFPLSYPQHCVAGTGAASFYLSFVCGSAGFF